MTPIRLHLNENAFADDSPVAAVLESFAANRYPAMDYADVYAVLAGWLRVDPAQILLGNGSTEIIHRIYAAVGAAAPGDVLVGSPTYILYRELAEQYGVPAHVVAGMDPERLGDAIDDRTRLIIVCTPNNPGGEIASLAELDRLARRAGDRVLLVDEAYLDYLGEPGDMSAIALCATRPNVVVSRTFSKLFGLAGLRFGYAITSTPLAATLRREFPHWNINGLAATAAMTAVRHRDWFSHVRTATRAEYERVAAALATAFTIVGTPGLPFLVAVGPGAAEFAGVCAGRGILLRDLGGSGAEAGLRISIGAPGDTDALLAAFAVWTATIRGGKS